MRTENGFSLQQVRSCSSDQYADDARAVPIESSCFLPPLPTGDRGGSSAWKEPPKDPYLQRRGAGGRHLFGKRAGVQERTARANNRGIPRVPTRAVRVVFKSGLAPRHDRYTAPASIARCAHEYRCENEFSRQRLNRHHDCAQVAGCCFPARVYLPNPRRLTCLSCGSVLLTALVRFLALVLKPAFMIRTPMSLGLSGLVF